MSSRLCTASCLLPAIRSRLFLMSSSICSSSSAICFLTGVRFLECIIEAQFAAQRRGQGASVPTVNRECATLRRMFSIQIEAGKLVRRPVFKMLDSEKIRQGFVEHGDFGWLLQNLPEQLQALVEFLYYGGWRKSAARNLEWKEIDMHGRTARLKAEDSKNDEPWVLPLAGRLWEIVQARAKARRLDCPFVFHQDGQKIGDFRKAWQTACVAAELGSFVKKEPVGDEVKKNAGGKSIPGCSFMTCAAALPETCPVQASPKWSP
jgi:integrase